jgi:adenylate kinase
MKESFKKEAVIIYGPPGSGKGTMASLLAKNFNFINFDTGQYLRKLLYNPKFKKNKIIKKEKLLNESGKLNTPSWVLKIVSQATKKISGAGWGIVFQGSPRTIFEAFGDQKHIGLMKTLEKFYDRKNIFIFELKVKDETSIKRNSNRVACGVCGQPSLFLYTGKLPCCAFCAGPLKKRPDDVLKIIKTRLIEYQERTQPIIQKLKEKGYQVIKINGEPAPYKIFQKIAQRIK